jgi:hypothetical protein
MTAFDYCHLDFGFENSDSRQAHAWQYTPTGSISILQDTKGYRPADDAIDIAAMGKVLTERGWMKINDPKSHLFKKALPDGQQESHAYRLLHRVVKTVKVGLFRKEHLGQCELLQITPVGLVAIRLEICSWNSVKEVENRMSEDLLKQGWQRIEGYFVKANQVA